MIGVADVSGWVVVVVSGEQAFLPIVNGTVGKAEQRETINTIQLSPPNVDIMRKKESLCGLL